MQKQLLYIIIPLIIYNSCFYRTFSQLDTDIPDLPKETLS